MLNLHTVGPGAYNIMPQTENDTVNQYFIHTSFGWSTPKKSKKSEKEVITELQQEIEQLQQRIQEQLSIISDLKNDNDYKHNIWEILLRDIMGYA